MIWVNKVKRTYEGSDYDHKYMTFTATELTETQAAHYYPSIIMEIIKWLAIILVAAYIIYSAKYEDKEEFSFWNIDRDNHFSSQI